jgi:hypothetical protein
VLTLARRQWLIVEEDAGVVSETFFTVAIVNVSTFNMLMLVPSVPAVPPAPFWFHVDMLGVPTFAVTL